ncbi:hypothetical protein M758_10G132900 [Ceratodon purpureus]|nr:hypothetical protein M758_10G132900 [Ceratodon purpureus]
MASMDWNSWNERLKELVEVEEQRGRIKAKLLDKGPEYVKALFDDTDGAVRAALLALIEPAGADGELREERNTFIENINSKLDSISALLQESLSRTRAASTINVDDLRVLRRCLDINLLPEEEEVSLESLLGTETEGGESDWDGDTYELQRRDDFKRQFQRMTSSRDVIWNDANREPIKVRFSNLEFPVSAKNDLVLCLKRFGSLIDTGAILGVEIKKRLSWRGLRQAEVEFYVWARESLFPFVQLITDMEKGGVAIYCKGGNDVRLRTLGSMEAVRNFVSGLVKSLPPGAGDDDREGNLVKPDTFPSPSRKRLRSSSPDLSSANPQGGNSSIGRQMAFWSVIASINNNLGDVANLRDLDCFNVDPVS